MSGYRQLWQYRGDGPPYHYGFTDHHATGPSMLDYPLHVDQGVYCEGNAGPSYQEGDTFTFHYGAAPRLWPVVTFDTAPPPGPVDFARAGWGGAYGNLMVGGQLSFNGTAAMAKHRLQGVIADDRERTRLDGDLWRGYRWRRTGVLHVDHHGHLRNGCRLERCR